MVSGVKFHLAQLNIARALAPLDDPLMADFVAALDRINALAEASPGFVWRLQDESGNATEIRAFDDPLVIVNLSVWESVEALFDYVYKGGHAGVLARRRGWFEKAEGPHLALWWVPAGHRPDVFEARERLARLEKKGPSAEAFTFGRRFPAPNRAMAG